MEKIVTIGRYVLDQQHLFPDASGDLSSLLYDVALSGKIIASRVKRAGLEDILGKAGGTNVHGEEQMKLDVFADRTIFNINCHTGRLAIMGSEEQEEPVQIPERHRCGKYVLLYDPLDGSSNIDVNVSVGTIFSIFRRRSPPGRGTLSDCLQRGRDLVAAGYIIYGPSTMLVYTAGAGVCGFTLDPAIGEFLLSHPVIRFPERPKYYSTNHAYEQQWTDKMRGYVDYLRGRERGLTLRWVGSLVADFHRNLLAGGTFCYPADSKSPAGKLRLLYEAAPLAFIASQAGGYASDGKGPILDIQPGSLHERVPLFIGDAGLTKKAEEMLA